MKKSVKIVLIVVLILAAIFVIFVLSWNSIKAWIMRDMIVEKGRDCLDVNMDIIDANWNQTSESISYDVLRKAGGPFLNATIIHVIDGAVRKDLAGEISLEQLTSSRYISPNNAYPSKPTKIEIAASFEIDGRTKTCEIAGETRKIDTI